MKLDEMRSESVDLVETEIFVFYQNDPNKKQAIDLHGGGLRCFQLLLEVRKIFHPCLAKT